MPNRNLVSTHLLYMLLLDRTLCRATTEGSTLTLLRLSPDDSGTYTCLAVNLAGRQTKIYTLFVLGQEDSILSESCSVWTVYLWFAPSQFLHPSLVRPQCPERYRWLRTALWLWSARQWEALLPRSVGWRTDTLCSSVLVLAFSQLTLCWGQF